MPLLWLRIKNGQYDGMNWIYRSSPYITPNLCSLCVAFVALGLVMLYKWCWGAEWKKRRKVGQDNVKSPCQPKTKWFWFRKDLIDFFQNIQSRYDNKTRFPYHHHGIHWDWKLFFFIHLVFLCSLHCSIWCHKVKSWIIQRDKMAFELLDGAWIHLGNIPGDLD